MIAIAWIDTPGGRRWAALRGLMLMIVGAIASYNTGGPGTWEPIFQWLGRCLLLFGALGIMWAYLHPSR